MREKELLKKIISISECESDAERICSEIIENYGNAYSVFDSDSAFFAEKIKMKKQTSTLISIISLVKRKYISDKNKTKSINCTGGAKKYFEKNIKEFHNEIISAVMLDKKFSVLCSKNIPSKKGLSVSSLCRVFAESVILYSGTEYIIIAHNHPSGNAEPSFDDIFYTNKIIQAMKIMNVKVLDHIIIGKDKSISMKQEYDIFENVSGYKKSCP